MSELLSMMMSGGKKKTLNLTAYNGATYDSDYIYTRNGTNIPVNYDGYFKTDNFQLYKNDNSIRFKLKVLFSDVGSSPYTYVNFYNSYTPSTAFSMYFNASSNIWVLLQGNKNNNYSASKNTWYYFDIIKEKNSNLFNAYISIDKTNYTLIHSNTITENNDNYHIEYGYGSTNSSMYNFKGKIDFKETDIIINGTSILWV